MDEKHKAVLKRYQNEFYRDLIVTDHFTQQLVREGVFSEDLASLIKAERSNDGKVQKLLEILPKRGPKAFGKFLKVLQENYEWMAKDLSDLERQETDNSDTRATVGRHDCENENADRLSRSGESTNSSTLEDENEGGTSIGQSRENMSQQQFQEENPHHGQEVRKVRSQEQRLRVDISNLTRQVKAQTDEKTELEDAIKESLGFLQVRCDDETESSLALVLMGNCKKMMKENESEKKKSTELSKQVKSLTDEKTELKDAIKESLGFLQVRCDDETESSLALVLMGRCKEMMKDIESEKKKSTELSKQKREYEVRVAESEALYKKMENMHEQMMGNRAELSRQLAILNAEQQLLKNKIKEALRTWDARFHYRSLISIVEHLIKRYKEMEVQIEQQRRQFDPPQQVDSRLSIVGSTRTFHRQTSLRRPRVRSTHDWSFA